MTWMIRLRKALSVQVVGGPGLVVKPDNHQAEGCVEPLGHFAIVSCFVVEFSAFRGVCAIVNGGGNSSN
jgi:hypothetical protein